MIRTQKTRHHHHAPFQFVGRQKGGPGGGHGFGGSFGRRFGGGDFPASRKFSSEELQLLLLALLAERPAHGYELIRQLEEKSGGFYAPSPGMIYPALTYLDEIGQAAATPEGNRKLYTLTEAGRTHLEANRPRVDAILDTLARIGSRMSEVREAFAGVDASDPQAADEIHQARRTIKQALMSKRGCSVEEARRIAEILNRAAREILGPSH
ncbi:helix-turn-helix transcriptional regulator [Acetobacter sp. TBRC 12305]|uniref:Helix-turn-helix transcriptional regulator n=1 Tax=Acetobacter garciniae TaxID=2817435 RepID=A0A939HN18_9PROT|nr:helix-turn-helix transcriptional regulator [Acetobacter garciniae]MBO1325221.1 helix-turn-helix transcriptional regulator [Acetobacter garciniae]MBX0344808.1 helix-turn-helix transcriptional regulator [Acetobacter garciniae]